MYSILLFLSISTLVTVPLGPSPEPQVEPEKLSHLRVVVSRKDVTSETSFSTEESAQAATMPGTLCDKLLIGVSDDLKMFILHMQMESLIKAYFCK